MSKANVDLLRRLYDAINTPHLVSEAVELVHPDFEWVNPDYALEPGVRRGRSGFEAVIRNLDGAFESYSHEPREFVDLGDTVICFVTFAARGRDSGITFRKLEPHVWTFRDGRPLRIQWFHDVDDALRAAEVTRSDPRLQGALETAAR